MARTNEKTTTERSAADWHRLALERQKTGDREGAIEALTQAAHLDRRVARYQHELGNALLDDGKIDRAISAYRRALRIDDAAAEAHNDLGTAYFEKGWHAEAEECFRKAIALKPEHGVAHANLGAALRAQGRTGDSRRAFQRALLLKLRSFLPAFLRRSTAAAPAPVAPDGEALKALSQKLRAIVNAVTAGKAAHALEAARQAEIRYPGDPDVLHVHAVALEESREPAKALDKVDAAIELKQDRSEYHITRARILVRLMRYDEALKAAAEALRLEPGSAVVLATIAGIYHPWHDTLAVQAAQRAVEIDPACDIAHGNLASALWGLSRLDEAEKHAREAVRLNPEHLGFRTNLALVLKDQGKLDEAREMYRTMVEKAPNYPKVCLDMGILAVECDGDLEAARAWYRKAQSGSDNPRGWLSEAIVNLLDARFEEGWLQYEWRKKTPDQRPQQQPFERFPAWQGEAMDEGRLLVFGEQGLGDEIMFASIYEDLGKRVRNVRLLCDVRVAALFRRSFPSYEVVGMPRDQFAEHAAGIKDVDKVVAAGSLGQYFRRRAADFPGRAYLRADGARVAQWREKLAVLGGGRAVGLSWMGGMQRTGRSRRSLGAAELEPLLGLPGIRWVSLQHNDDGRENGRIHRFDGVTRDMDELASLIGALDLVVSVCNTTVHVAGAIGKEVLVMAPFVPEWRYGMSGERMVWYPSARVFRQPRYGDWSGVIERVRAALSRG